MQSLKRKIIPSVPHVNAGAARAGFLLWICAATHLILCFPAPGMQGSLHFGSPWPQKIAVLEEAAAKDRSCLSQLTSASPQLMVTELWALSCPVAFSVLFITAVDPDWESAQHQHHPTEATDQPLAESGLQSSEVFLSCVASKDASQAQLPRAIQGVLTEDGRSTHRDRNLARGSLEKAPLLLPVGMQRRCL